MTKKTARTLACELSWHTHTRRNTYTQHRSGLAVRWRGTSKRHWKDTGRPKSYVAFRSSSSARNPGATLPIAAPGITCNCHFCTSNATNASEGAAVAFSTSGLFANHILVSWEHYGRLTADTPRSSTQHEASDLVILPLAVVQLLGSMPLQGVPRHGVEDVKQRLQTELFQVPCFQGYRIHASVAGRQGKHGVFGCHWHI
jgi:hypothetical protein